MRDMVGAVDARSLGPHVGHSRRRAPPRRRRPRARPGSRLTRARSTLTRGGLPTAATPTQTAIAAARVLPSRRAGIAETTESRGERWLSPRKPSRELISKHGENDKDTGSTDVQVAMLTRRINELTEHLRTHPKDHYCGVGCSSSRSPPALPRLPAAQGPRGLSRSSSRSSVSGARPGSTDGTGGGRLIELRTGCGVGSNLHLPPNGRVKGQTRNDHHPDRADGHGVRRGGAAELRFETGKLAKQADGAVVVMSGDTMIPPRPPSGGRTPARTRTSSR